MKILKKIVLLIIAFMMLTTSVYAATTRTKKRIYREKQINFLNILTIIYPDYLYFNGENDTITPEEKKNNNILVASVGIAFLIYWIALLLIYEREKTYDYTYDRDDDDIKFLKRYNPMLAGCLVDNREVLPRDVTAVVLNLIKKEAINLEMIPKADSGKEDYIYMISENKEKQTDLDEIEGYVLGWIFGFYEEEEVDLIQKLKRLSKQKDFLDHLDKLNNMAQKELHEMGANISKVPLFLRIVNVMLVIFSVIVSVVHIINNGLNIHIYETTIYLILLIIGVAILIIPIVALIMHLLLLIIAIFRKVIKTTTDRYSGKAIVPKIIYIITSFALIILILFFIVPNKYICLDVFMIGMAVLIVRTDNLMTKHNDEILNDYYCLQEIKYKIAEYSLIKDEQINYIKLWEEYLIYAVAFGIPIPIINKFKGSYKEDKDLVYLLKCESLYYVCKAYLEVMFDMNFKPRRKKYNLKDIFRV